MTVDSDRRDAETSSTMTLSAGARSQRTNSETSSTSAASHARLRRPSHANHNGNECAYARTVFGERSIADRCAKNRSAGSTVTRSSSRTVHDSTLVTGITSRCTRTAAPPGLTRPGQPSWRVLHPRSPQRGGRQTHAADNASPTTSCRLVSHVNNTPHGAPVIVDSAMALSIGSPTDPTEGAAPISASRSV